MSAPLVCAIGTTDPWNAAGLGLDLRALTECGARPLMVVTAVSAQDARGLQALHAIPQAMIAAQFAALRALPVAAYRVGALPGEAIGAVAAFLAGVAVPVVIDPVLGATRGGAFVEESGVAAIGRHLIPRATFLTPNCDEARRLAGIARCDDLATMSDAARRLAERGASGVLVTGGRRDGLAFDVYFDGEIHVFEHALVATEMRGTGCLLAAALAAALARGIGPHDAIREARAYVRGKLERSIELGGMRVAE
jgi:hydroxymethylpyrimidine/phosphomethylpyrimidine kinase